MAFLFRAHIAMRTRTVRFAVQRLTSIDEGDFIDEINKVEFELMVKTFGDQGTTGFLLTVALRRGTNDQVRWWKKLVFTLRISIPELKSKVTNNCKGFF